jgi:hypothetical protein
MPCHVLKCLLRYLKILKYKIDFIILVEFENFKVSRAVQFLAT